MRRLIGFLKALDEMLRFLARDHSELDRTISDLRLMSEESKRRAESVFGPGERAAYNELMARIERSRRGGR